MINVIKQLILKICNMLSIFVDVGEDVAYSAKDLSTYTREGTGAFLKEARLERAKHYEALEKEFAEANIS